LLDAVAAGTAIVPIGHVYRFDQIVQATPTWKRAAPAESLWSPYERRRPGSETYAHAHVWRSLVKYRNLGRTGIKVSPYGLGALMVATQVGNPDPEDSIRVAPPPLIAA
jgi:hypothetical protein